MPQLVKKRRSGWALLAVSALVASLFAVGASPAAAIDDDSKPDHAADFTACLGEAIADQGFTDLGTLEAAVPNINCLAYYGISAGKTADTFDPNSDVTRGQMALFLVAAAKRMGVDLMGGDMMADFGDIAELGENRRNAITSLARNGIMSGSGGNFRPHDAITRAEMAVALVALLDHTPGVALSKPTKGDNAGLYVLGPAPGSLPNDHFTDARRQTPRHVDNAISAAYELGITSGVGDGTMFNPSGTVPRRNMATFIANALAHSNARPAGLTAQVDGTTIEASVRDAMLAPVVNATIDAFKTSTAIAARAFKDDGTCSSRAVTFEDAGVACEIDGGDAVTQTDGNVTLTLHGDVGEGQTAWVWTGALGDKVSADTDLVELAIKKGAATPVPATRVTMSTDLPTQPHLVAPTPVGRALFGSTVTVTVQLQGADPDDASAFVNTVPAAGQELKYTVSVSRFPSTDNTGTPVHSRIADQEVTIGSDGTATFTITGVDTDPNSRGQEQFVEYTVAAATGNTIATVDGSPGGVVFSDAAPVVTHVSVENSGPKVAPGANGRAGNRVTVTALDQYGRPVNNAPVFLHTSNPTGTNDPDGSTIRSRALNTRANGKVTFTYNYSGGASRETLKAAWDGYKPDPDGDGPLTVTGTVGVDDAVGDCAANARVSTAEGEDVCGTTTVDWVLATRAESQAAVSILSIDVENDQIIVDLQTNSVVTPTSVNYDNSDFFTLVNAANATPGKPLTIGEFEEAVAADLKAAAATTDVADDQPTLAWGSYIYDEPSDIATFTVTAGGSR